MTYHETDESRELISIHALREEGDDDFLPRSPRARISIHALREEGDLLSERFRLDVVQISIHALREEGDYLTARLLSPCWKFLSTPSARRATFYKDGEVSAEWISIHALREEGDRPPSAT